MNNSCGDILICRDKDKLDKATVIDTYDRLVSIKYGDVTGEPPIMPNSALCHLGRSFLILINSLSIPLR